MSQQGEIAVGLDGVADQRIDRGEGLLERLYVMAHRGKRIDVGRRAHGGSQLPEREILAVQPAVLVRKVVHC